MFANKYRGEVPFAGGVIRFNTASTARIETQTGRGFGEVFQEMVGKLTLLRVCLMAGYSGPGGARLKVEDANAMIDREGITATSEALFAALRLCFPDMFEADQPAEDGEPADLGNGLDGGGDG